MNKSKNILEYRRVDLFLKNLQKKLNIFYNKKAQNNLRVFNKLKNKKNFDPVTNFDKLFEKYIRKIINKSFPNDSIIGEEYKDKKTSSDFTWSIDPIDGTKAFLIGAPTWSNLIGLSYRNKSLRGLANFPALNKFYINDKKNSYLFYNGKKKKIKSSNNINLKKIKIIGNFHDKLSEGNQNKITKKFGWSFRLASLDALSYCLLAEGKVDGVVEANLKPYDILPLIPIIRNSGGVVTNWRNEPAEKGGKIIASSNKNLHNKILNILKPFA